MTTKVYVLDYIADDDRLNIIGDEAGKFFQSEFYALQATWGDEISEYVLTAAPMRASLAATKDEIEGLPHAILQQILDNGTIIMGVVIGPRTLALFSAD